MVQALVREQHGVFHEDGAGSQDEGGEEVDVDVVSRAPKLSANGDWAQKMEGERKDTLGSYLRVIVERCVKSHLERFWAKVIIAP